jgi:hypothetical protein
MIYSIFQKANIKNSITLLILQKKNLMIHLKKLAFVKISCSDKFSICLNPLGVHHLEKD